jgi:hypothetical protein
MLRLNRVPKNTPLSRGAYAYYTLDIQSLYTQYTVTIHSAFCIFAFLPIAIGIGVRPEYSGSLFDICLIPIHRGAFRT